MAKTDMTQPVAQEAAQVANPVPKDAQAAPAPVAAKPVAAPQPQVAQAAPISAQPQQAVMPIKAFKNVLENKEIQSRLGQLFDEKQKNIFITSALEVFSADSELQKCKPLAVMQEIMRAAAFQLPINKNLGFAYVLAYKGVPTFQLGYKAYIQFAMRTNQYRHINADLVYEGEISKIDKLSGIVELNGNRVSDKVVGYFAYFKTIGGFEKMEYMSVRDVAKHAIRYAPTCKKTSVEDLIALAGNGGTGKGWFGNFDGMALKTVLKRALSKYGVLSTEMQNAMAADRDDAEDVRNEAVATQANAQAVATEEVQYTVVEEQPY